MSAHPWIYGVDMAIRALIATDGTHRPIDAAKASLSLLADEVELILITVVGNAVPPVAYAGGLDGPGLGPQALAVHDGQENLAKAALASSSAELPSVAETEVIDRVDVGAAICDAAIEHQANVIVMGGSDKGWFRRLFEGSVIHYVVDHATVPVLIIPIGQPHQPGGDEASPEPGHG